MRCLSSSVELTVVCQHVIGSKAAQLCLPSMSMGVDKSWGDDCISSVDHDGVLTIGQLQAWFDGDYCSSVDQHVAI